MVLKEKDITADAVKKLRGDIGLTQSEFWGVVGVKQSAGCHYETKGTQIPKSVRMLIVARYVAGVEIDASTTHGVDALISLGLMQKKRTQAREEANIALRFLEETDEHIRNMKFILENVI